MSASSTPVGQFLAFMIQVSRDVMALLSNGMNQVHVDGGLYQIIQWFKQCRGVVQGKPQVDQAWKCDSCLFWICADRQFCRNLFFLVNYLALIAKCGRGLEGHWKTNILAYLFDAHSVISKAGFLFVISMTCRSFSYWSKQKGVLYHFWYSDNAPRRRLWLGRRMGNLDLLGHRLSDFTNPWMYLPLYIYIWMMNWRQF